MRISADRTDAGYSMFCAVLAEGKKVYVFLNEKEQQECITADDEAGFVLRLKLDNEGNPQVDPNDSNRVWSEKVLGDVRIECK